MICSEYVICQDKKKRDLEGLVLNRCNNMCESPQWNLTGSIIDVKRSLLKKVVKYWLWLIEASMASMRVFRNVYFGIQISKNMCTIRMHPKNTINNSLGNCSTTKTLTK